MAVDPELARLAALLGGIVSDDVPWWAGGPGAQHWRTRPAPWWAPAEGASPRTWYYNDQADAWHSVT